MTLDPITLEIQWNRLVTIANEADLTVVRTSFSSIVGESHDFACVLFDAEGHSVAQSAFGPTLFTATLPHTVQHFLSVFPAETLRDGDVLCTNDPWLGTGHLPDLCLAIPVFHRGRLAGFVGVVAHVSDIGGTAGYHDAKDLFEEGLQIPPCKLYHAGQPGDVMALLAQNVRVPDQVIGDVRAMVSAGHVGRERLIEFLTDYDLADLATISAAVRDRARRVMERAIAEMPDGVYRAEVTADGWEDPLRIACTVTVAGQRMVIDYAGSSPEYRAGAVNVPLSATRGDTLTTIKCALAPHIPNNDGLFAPIEIRAPEGCVLNCRRPAAVKARSKTSVHVHEALYGALAQAIPEQVQAGTGAFWIFIANGRYPSGDRYNVWFIPNGGKGATALGDGHPCMSFPSNGTVTPAEILEHKAPLLMEEKELTVDSAGPGRYRGGNGQRIVITSLAPPEEPALVTLRPNNVHFPSPGFGGGQPAPLGGFSICGQSPNVLLEAMPMGRGEQAIFTIPGGGGFGSPLEREPVRVLADVEAGLVSAECARNAYGVVIEDGELDEAATQALRQALLVERSGQRP